MFAVKTNISSAVAAACAKSIRQTALRLSRGCITYNKSELFDLISESVHMSSLLKYQTSKTAAALSAAAFILNADVNADVKVDKPAFLDDAFILYPFFEKARKVKGLRVCFRQIDFLQRQRDCFKQQRGHRH